MNKIVSVIFAIFLLIGVPLLLAFLLDIKQTKIQAILATYVVVVVGSFLVYFHLQNQSKKKLKELKKEQEKAELFIQEQTLKLYNLYEKMQRAKKELKTKGLSKPEKKALREEAERLRLEALEITDVYSSKFF